MTTIRSIQQALDFIEKNLTRTLSIEELARASGMSFWHFQRTFTAMVGEPVGRYLRRRRIASAAERLADFRGRLLDLAIEYQFESHEAFTRAFKADLSATPSDWKSGLKTNATPRTRESLTQDTLNHRYLAMKLLPEFVTLPSATFIGFEAPYVAPGSVETNNLDIIPKLWGLYFQRIAEIPSNDPGASYGLSEDPETFQKERSHPDESLYLAGARVDPEAEVPDGMTRWTSPGGLFAKFEHRGPTSKIGDTMSYIYAKWFPESGYSDASGPVYQRIDQRFIPDSNESLLEIFVPVKS